MVSITGFDVPPPGGAVTTVISTTPALRRSLPGIVACRVLTLTTFVGRSAPFQRTLENALKPDPFRVSVKDGAVACAWSGESVVIAGAGFVIDARVASAS